MWKKQTPEERMEGKLLFGLIWPFWGYSFLFQTIFTLSSAAILIAMLPPSVNSGNVKAYFEGHSFLLLVSGIAVALLLGALTSYIVLKKRVKNKKLILNEGNKFSDLYIAVFKEWAFWAVLLQIGIVVLSFFVPEKTKLPDVMSGAISAFIFYSAVSSQKDKKFTVNIAY